MCKNDSKVVNLFALSGSTSIKAAHKTLTKLTLGLHHTRQTMYCNDCIPLENSKAEVLKLFGTSVL